MLRRPLKSEYDVAIIGAGVSGLTAAALLSKFGLSVCVVEKEPHVGGYLAGFRRRGFKFDTAIHWLNQCGPGGLVQRLFEVLGKNHPVAIPQRRIRRYVGNGFDFLLTNQPDEMKEKLIETYPHEKKGIERFFCAAKSIGQSLNNFAHIIRSEETMSLYERLTHKLKLLRFAIPFIPYISYSGAKGFPRGLRKFFKDESIHKIFASETELISCLVPIGWAYFGDFQSPPKGGGQMIPEWLEQVVESNHGDIFCSARVEQVLVEGNICKGIAFEQRGIPYKIRSKYVIAASDVETLYEKLLPSDIVPLKLKSKLREAELYNSSLTVSIALDCTTESLGFDEELVHIAGCEFPFCQTDLGDPSATEISVLAPSGRDKTMAPPGQGTLTLYMPASMDYQGEWCTQKDALGNYVRGEAYKKLKTEMAETIISRVEQKIAPGLRSHIIFYEVSTPVTHWRYTGNKNGSIMGAKPGRKNMTNKVAHYRTPVKNLILGGHWAELGGGVPIAVKAASNASLIVLRKENKSAFLALAAFMENKIGLEKFLADLSFSTNH